MVVLFLEQTYTWKDSQQNRVAMTISIVAGMWHTEGNKWTFIVNLLCLSAGVAFHVLSEWFRNWPRFTGWGRQNSSKLWSCGKLFGWPSFWGEIEKAIQKRISVAVNTHMLPVVVYTASGFLKNSFPICMESPKNVHAIWLSNSNSGNLSSGKNYRSAWRLIWLLHLYAHYIL